MTDDWLTVLHGDCRDVLRTLPDESVNCCVTSPPYWGLRDYGTAAWTGGDADCDHRVGGQVNQTKDRGTLRETAIAAGQRPGVDASRCRSCGATRVDQQIGLESTPEQYVAQMVDVFREVRRVLRKDGTLWLNLGDSYTSIGRSGRKESPGVGAKQEISRVERDVVWAPRDDGDPDAHFRWSLPGGQKPKDLVGIPWRVAFALQADGWYLRSDIIWSKPNPMPESVTDRPTKSHEYLFLLTKSPTYHYDADAIAEPATTDRPELLEFGPRPDIGYPGGTQGRRRRKSVERGGFNGKTEAMPGRNAFRAITETRNRRSVWTIATQPYPGAHFATFPPKLVEPCILAGCPEGGTVLDPFAGTGTVGMVAQKLSRRAVLIDLNGEYLDQLRERNAQTPLGLTA